MVKLGSPNISNIPPPGREPDEALPAVITEAHARDCYLSAQAIDKAMNTGAAAAHHYLTLSVCQTKVTYLCDNGLIYQDNKGRSSNSLSGVQENEPSPA
jgi:hypothetical protein